MLGSKLGAAAGRMCWPCAQAELQEGSVHPFLGIILVPMTDAQVRSGQFRLWCPKLPWLPCLVGREQGSTWMFTLLIYKSFYTVIVINTPCNPPRLCKVTSSNYWWYFEKSAVPSCRGLCQGRGWCPSPVSQCQHQTSAAEDTLRPEASD